MPNNKAGHGPLTGGRRLAKNTLWNLLGQGLPLLVGLATIPLLIDGLGVERFGILVLAWMVIGYFSLFDLGLGRALTKLVAENLGTGRDQEIPELIWTALVLMGVLGLIGAAVLAALSPWLVQGVLKIPAALRGETLGAFYLLALSIPLVVGTTGLRGVLEAHQRFGLVNAVRIPMGLWTFLGPLVVLHFSKSLFAIVAVLMAGRLIAWMVHLWLCLRVVPALRHGTTIRRAIVGPLLSFGGWMTVSNIVGPLMVYFDRFLIGAMLSMTAVAYYATPYEVVTKLWVVPMSLIGVLFPAFSYNLPNNRRIAEELFSKGLKYVFITMFPITFLFIYYGDEAMYLWLGKEFSERSGLILRVMAIGVLVNSVAQVPSAFIQALGRPDIKAKIHLAELPFFIVIVVLFVGQFGILGAAIAFLIRMLLDFVAFLIMAIILCPAIRKPIKRVMAAVCCGLIVILPSFLFDLNIMDKVLLSSFIMLMFAWIVWILVLDKREKHVIMAIVR